MNKIKPGILCIAGCIALSLTGCNNQDPNTLDAQNSQEQSTPEDVEKTDPQIMLENTYTSKFQQEGISIFSFDYPDNWEVIEETLDPSLQLGFEKAKLRNDQGLTITFTNMFGTAITQGIDRMATTYYELDISKAADASLVLTDGDSAPEECMVARLTVTGQTSQGGQGYTPVNDGKVAFAVLPKSRIGTVSDIKSSYIIEFACKCRGGNMSLIAESPNGAFTPEEEKEVIAILASLKEQTIAKAASA